MARFDIPERYKAGFNDLQKIDEDNFNKLIEVLKTIPAGHGITKFEEAINAEVKISPILLKTIFSFGNLLNYQSGPVEQIAIDLAKSYEESLEEEKQDDIPKLSKRLHILLDNCANLKDTFKAITLLTENNNVFRGAKVISDIRLIFKDDLNLGERSAVIIHKLKVDYREDNMTKDVYFSLDSQDLEDLLKQITRAQEKEKILRQDYKNLNFLSITE